jgi:D-tyrosyl-tRNA(Tyr) deacylase
VRVVAQRVSRGRVSVDGQTIAEIGRGLVLLVGVGHGDTLVEADWLAEKCAGLRIFEDEQGKMNLALGDVGGKALVVSQFTLYADAGKGRRPSFIDAAPPEVAKSLIEAFAASLGRLGIEARLGQFGDHMLVEIDNDGPVTIVLERGSAYRRGR